MQDLPEVLNWRRLNENITSSGQPTEEQLSEIKGLGVTHVINLESVTDQGALDDEAGAVADLGMRYTYIPVDFANPTEEDYAKFTSAIEKLEGKKIHVHRIYNARVSAFFYRYAKSGKRGIFEADADALMDEIWRLGGVWAKFIRKDKAVALPHQYKGYGY